MLDHWRAFREDMCECTDCRCAREVDHVMLRWHQRHDEPARVASADEQALRQQIAACETTANAGASPVLLKMEAFRDEMCDCARHNRPGCEKRISDDMTRWATTEAREHPVDSSAQPTADELAVGKSLAECTVRAMMEAQSPAPGGIVVLPTP